MKHKKYSADEKLAVVMAMLKGEKTVAQICKEYGISDGISYRWRDEALESMKAGFLDQIKKRHDTLDAKKERLLKLIGKQAVSLIFKKKSQWNSHCNVTTHNNSF
jgi:transposase-like protein